MSIVEETLRKMQEKQEAAKASHDNSGTTSAADKNVSKNIKPAFTRPFVMTAIGLVILGLLKYIGFDRFQEKLFKKQKNVSKNKKPARTRPFVMIAIGLVILGLLTYIGFDRYQEKLYKKHGDLSFKKIKLKTVRAHMVKAKSLPAAIELKDELQKLDGVVESNQETSATPITKESKIEPEPKEIVVFGDKPQEPDRQYVSTMKPAPGSSLQEKGFTSPEIDRDVDSDQKTSITKADESTTELVEKLKHSEEVPTSLFMEELVVEKQLDRAKYLINIGSYAEAIDILKPIVDSSAETWNAYLLMGAAYLGMGELYHAESYLDMGLAVNGKNPQLWLQRAIVEQQKGNHKSALQILDETQKLAPDLPEVYLNIGYSNDAIGRKQSSAKAYNTFIKLTEGNTAYMIVRHKVLERLQYLK